MRTSILWRRDDRSEVEGRVASICQAECIAWVSHQGHVRSMFCACRLVESDAS